MTVLRTSDLAPRRGLRRAQAAAYIGISESKFAELVATGRMPAGFALDGCTLWDMRDLDAAFDDLKDGAHRTKRQLAELDRL